MGHAGWFAMRLIFEDGVHALRVASLWLLCEIRYGKIVGTSWGATWGGCESVPLRLLFEESKKDPFSADPYVVLGGTRFQQSVWRGAMRIPFGRVVGYGELGRSIGCQCAQAVGQALKRNGIFWFVPCHRVVLANGALGGYAPGAAFKRLLLDYERQASERG